MKLIFAAVALLALGILRPGPVSADTMSTCDMTTVQSLTQCVQMAAANGYIDDQGITSSLLAKTAAAQAAVNQGQNAVAINVLKAFISEVQAQSGIHIQADHAAHMVMHAQNVIKALGG